jgi:ABC-type sugar transport system permease subunit
MRRVIAFAAIISTIGMFNLFDVIYVLVGAGGGTDRAGLLTGPFIFQQAFGLFKFGYASASAYVVALIIVGLSLLQIRASERGELE